ncbi:hypothetical protein ACFWXK_24335 [Streptomyces sp. NPDC059070]|uniref:hypothetical protein n=1 Tax=Streptomyces sp. NPDC059070 TaxID=3346713 RepID=UPI0036C97FEB
MDTSWDHAHIDHTLPIPPVPAPAGLAESPAEWSQRLADAPHGWLLRDNAMTRTLTGGGPIRLMHTTVALDAIRASGHLYASSGCLVAALYCAPLTPEPDGLRPHNLGQYLLETKPHTDTLVIEITPDAPVPPKGIDYLRLGPIHLRTHLQHAAFLTPAEEEHLRRTVMARLRAAAPFLDLALANASGTQTPAAVFTDQLAAAVPHIPFLGYLYFEVLSEYLMLHSTTAQTRAYAERGELNNRLYKHLAHAAVDGMDQLFDLARFHPDHQQLTALTGQIDPSLAAGAAEYTRRRLSHLFACLALDPGEEAAAFTFRRRSFAALTDAAPGLMGQLLFREMRIMDRYPQLYACLEHAKALEAWNYWNTEGIPTPFNGFLPKGEIGVNPAYPRATCTVWAAKTCSKGLLHPVEQLDVAFLPRLADLGQTAMRRDEAGRAAGHLKASRDGHRPDGLPGQVPSRRGAL